MLSFNQQYDLAHGIFITYDSQLNYRLLHSKHKHNTRERTKMFFPYQKWENRKKETFVLACVYIMYSKTPSSFRALLDELRELDLKEIARFKHLIMNYRDYISKDVSYLKETYGSSITPETVLQECVKNNIQFYTAHWFLKLYKKEYSLNRVLKHVKRKIDFVMLFLTFKEESIKTIKTLFNQIEL